MCPSLQATSNAYHFIISHVPGKDLITADTLSRALTPLDKTANQTLLANVAAFVSMITNKLPATDQCLKEIMVKQREDENCVAIINYCNSGWPDINTIPSPLKPYWPYRSEFNIDHDGLLLCGQQIVILSKLQPISSTTN